MDFLSGLSDDFQMFEHLSLINCKVKRHGFYHVFKIIMDHSRTTLRGGQVRKGFYSNGDEFDKVSESSAHSGMLLLSWAAVI